MYLKNVSSTCTCIINTVVGKITVKPGEIINMKERVLPPISSNIRETTEEEYLQFREGKQNIMEQVIEQEEIAQTTDTPVPNTPVVDESSVDCSVEEETAPVDVPNTNNNPMVEFVQNLFPQNPSETDVPLFAENEQTIVKEDESIEQPVVEEQPALQVQKTDMEEQKEKLQQEITDLQQTWVETKAVSKKAKLGKQIKELKKQLEKLL